MTRKPQLRDRWRLAFARQARSDREVYETLCRMPGLPVCHRLHYVQMFLEKLCKSFLWSTHDPTRGSPEFLTSHNVVVKVLPALVRKYCLRNKLASMNPQEFQELRDICRQIDLLSPSVNDDGRRPDNAEYPWAAMVKGMPAVCAPSEWDFPIQSRLNSPLGRVFLKSAGAILQSLLEV